MNHQKSRRSWFAFGGLFMPYCFDLPSGGKGNGCQTITALDVESEFFIEKWIARRPAAPFSAAELLPFIERVLAQNGRHETSVLILPSVWRSSSALFDDPSTHDRIAGVHDLGFDWDEMQEAERLKIALRLQSLGHTLIWEESELPPL